MYSSARRSFLLDTAVRAALPLAAVGAWPLRGHAQPAPASAPKAELSGVTLDGKRLTLQELRGKVVLVWFWSTTCAVCRDVLPELRANYAGWHGKPFQLVTVATDAAREEVVKYGQIVEAIVPLRDAPLLLWRRDASYRDNFPKSLTLPAAFIVDPSGRVVQQYAGRIPALAWDQISDLLP